MDSTLYPDDIVAKRDDRTKLAVVERTHNDVDTHTPYPAKFEREPIIRHPTISLSVMQRFLTEGIPPKGVLLIRLQMEACLELISASQLVLVDRSLLIGDVVKRDVSDAMSGVVLNTHTKCTLQPMCDVTYQGSVRLKGLLLPPGTQLRVESQFQLSQDGQPKQLVDVPASELRSVESPTEGDIVVYKDWIGRVEAVTNYVSVRLSDNCVVEVLDEVGEHTNGRLSTFCVGDLLKCVKGVLRTGNWIYGRYNPNTPPVGTVVKVRTVSTNIDWLQKRVKSLDEDPPPGTLQREELESQHFQVYDRTKWPRNLSRPESTQKTVSNSEIDMRLNLRVRFHDFTEAVQKYSDPSALYEIPQLDRKDNLGYDLNVFDVVFFHTDVTVQWQDLTITTEKSVDVVPDASIDDEHAAWPGEIVHSLDRKPVPTLEFVEQPERVGVVQSVSEAYRMAKVRWYSNSCVQYIFSKEAPSTLLHFCMDRSNPIEEDVSLYDIEAPAELNVRRGDIVLFAHSELNNPGEQPNDQTWLGEIVDTRLDGTLAIRLGAAAAIRDVIVAREQCVVVIRSDGTGPMGELDGMMSDSDDEMDDGWDDEDEDEDEASEDELEARFENENGEPMDQAEVEDEEWESEDDDDDMEMADAHSQNASPTSPTIQPDNVENKAMPDPPSQSANSTSEPAEAYTILDENVPRCHRYRDEPSSSDANRMKRIQKEHKILQKPSSIPAGVYIRTWESRLDLLRVLLIGPTETPYSNSPFIIDFYLPPYFPFDPPQAFFHSWPPDVSIGSSGRVNPNLYEDGNICLSILGTWDGNKAEGWSPVRSTLLQVIVSLLGLVLVREPYFNEAGYESLVGSEASRRPSALYNERAFLRSKSFTITALSSLSSPPDQPLRPGLEGFRDVFAWLYSNPSGPRLLHTSIVDVEGILERSEKNEELPDGLIVMSRGACIPLKRIIDKFRQLGE